MKSLKKYILIAFSLMLTAGIQAQEVADVDVKIAVVNVDEQFYSGANLSDIEDFSTMSVKVTKGGEVLENHKIIGGIIYLKSDPKVRYGTIAMNGVIELTSADVFNELDGRQVNIELKVLNETSNERMSFTYSFF